MLNSERLRGAGQWLNGALGRIGLSLGPDVTEVARGASSMPDGEARRAFLPTLRAVIDERGQRVDARDRLYLAEAMPTLIVWGERDPVIPVEHGDRRARRDAGQPARDPRRRRPLPAAPAAG